MIKPKSKLIAECTAYWNAAYKLLNEDRIFHATEEGITTGIDDAYELTITDEWAMLCRKDTHVMCAKMRMGPDRENLLPFYTLLQWYLKRKEG